MKTKSILIALLLFQVFTLSAANLPREKQNFDFDWRFSVSDNATYSAQKYDEESTWDEIQIPHDWNIKMQFDGKGNGSAAYLPESIGWYRKHFNIPASSKNKKVMILFDGIFHQSDVYVNGHHLGYRPYGFCSIYYDMTPYLNFGGDNVIAVRANCTGDRPRWYAGSGIYRHAWLITTQPVSVDTYGTYITTPEVTDDHAKVTIVTTIANKSNDKHSISVSQRIIDSNGKTIASMPKSELMMESGSRQDVNQSTIISSPRLWSTDTPTLYTMVTTVKSDGKTSDIYTSTFGIRSFYFDQNKGLFLNGKHLKLKGLCLHADNGSTGTAVPDRAYERRLQILKEYGCNAIRCAHNQPSPEFLDMCDRMGFLVIDEAFDKWKSGYYAKYFDEWWQRDMSNMILRDRNHPSIILWSIGNELQEAWSEADDGVERATMLRDFVHKMEPTRPTVLAAQNNHQDKFSGITDVIGYNYLEARAISDHKKHPERRFLITEELPYYSGEEGNIRSYNTNNPWNIISENDFFAGGFIWSGVDYLGEAGWPSKGWPNGLFDICMNEKPRAAFLRAMWKDEPVVRIAVMDQSLDIDHGRDLWQWPRMAAQWNFPWQYDGLVMEVRTITNCESVRLFVNGKQMGEQKTASFPNHTIVWNVPYAAGYIEAVGMNGGKEVARYKLTTSGKTSQADVTADRHEITADGQDLSFISIQLKDKDGNPVQTDDRKITATVTGDGRFLGIDNGDLRREISFAGNALKTYMGRALITVQSARKAGVIHISVLVDGIDTPYDLDVTTHK
jgi:beta-galactosidase